MLDSPTHHANHPLGEAAPLQATVSPCRMTGGSGQRTDRVVRAPRQDFVSRTVRESRAVQLDIALGHDAGGEPPGCLLRTRRRVDRLGGRELTAQVVLVAGGGEQAGAAVL